MKQNATILAAATICALTVVGVLMHSQIRAVQAQRIDTILRQMSSAFQKGDIKALRMLCTPDCATKLEEWMRDASNARSGSLGWHPLADPPPALNPVIEKGHGTGNVDYFPNASWSWGLPGHYGQFYRFRQESGAWRFAGYHDVVR